MLRSERGKRQISFTPDFASSAMFRGNGGKRHFVFTPDFASSAQEHAQGGTARTNSTSGETHQIKIWEFLA